MFYINKAVDIIFDDIEDKRSRQKIKNPLNIILILLIFILLILTIITIGSIFNLEFEWGFLDKEIVIATIPTLLAGYIGFLGAIIGVMGAYLIFYLQLKKNNQSEKKKADSILEYKKLMLFNLLDYTILKTDDIYQELNKFYYDYYKNGFVLPTIEGYENAIKGNLYNDCSRIYTLKDRPEVRTFQSRLKDLFNDKYLREYNLYEHVYDKNWTTYLDCIPMIDQENYIETIQRITTWITLLENSKIDSYNFNQIDPIEFVLKRRGIDFTIDELTPEIAKNGFRGKMNLANQKIYKR